MAENHQAAPGLPERLKLLKKLADLHAGPGRGKAKGLNMLKLNRRITALVNAGKPLGVGADVLIPELQEEGLRVFGNSREGKSTLINTLLGIPRRVVAQNGGGRQTSCITKIYNIHKPGQGLQYMFRVLPKRKEHFIRELTEDTYQLTFSAGGRLKSVVARPDSPPTAQAVAEALQEMIGDPQAVEALCPLPDDDQMPWVPLPELFPQTGHAEALDEAWTAFGGAHAVYVEEVNEGDLSQHPMLACMGEIIRLLDHPGVEADAYINRVIEASEYSSGNRFSIALLKADGLSNVEASVAMLHRQMQLLRAPGPRRRILIVIRNYDGDRTAKLDAMQEDLRKAVKAEEAPDGVDAAWVAQKKQELKEVQPGSAAHDALFAEVEALWVQWITSFPARFMTRLFQLENLEDAAAAEGEDAAAAEGEDAAMTEGEDAAAAGGGNAAAAGAEDAAPSFLSRLKVVYCDKDDPGQVERLWRCILDNLQQVKLESTTEFLDQSGILLSGLGCAAHERNQSLGRPNPAPELVAALDEKAKYIADKFGVKGRAELKWCKLYSDISLQRLDSIKEKLQKQLEDHLMVRGASAAAFRLCISDYLGQGSVSPSETGKARQLPSLPALLGPLLMCVKERDDAAVKAANSFYNYVASFQGTTRATASEHQLAASTYWQEMLDLAWKVGVEDERERLQAQAGAATGTGTAAAGADLQLERLAKAEALSREKLARMLNTQVQRELRNVLARRQALARYAGEAGASFITEELRHRGPWLQKQGHPAFTISTRKQGIDALVTIAMRLLLLIRDGMKADFSALVESAKVMAQSVASSLSFALELHLTPKQSLRHDSTNSTNLRSWFYRRNNRGHYGLKALARQLQRLMECASAIVEGGVDFKSFKGVSYLAAPEVFDADDAGAADDGVAQNTRRAKRARLVSTPGEEEQTAGETSAEDPYPDEEPPSQDEDPPQPGAHQFVDQTNLMMLANIVLEGHMALSPTLPPGLD